MKSLSATLCIMLLLAGTALADPQGKLLEQLDELTKLYLGDAGALDASKAGLKPDAEEDQTKKPESSESGP